MPHCKQCHKNYGPLDAVCPDCQIPLERERAAPTSPAPGWQAVAPVAPEPAAETIPAGPEAAIPVTAAAPPSPESQPDLSRVPTSRITVAPAAAGPEPTVNPSPGVPTPGAPPAGVSPLFDPSVIGPASGATYAYRARRPDGQIEEGKTVAVSDEAARSQLRAQGLWVSSLRLVSGKPSPAGGRTGAEIPTADGLPGAAPPRTATDVTSDSVFQAIYSGASLKAKAFFFRQLATMERSGISTVEALAILQSQTSNAVLRQIVVEGLAYCQAGGKLSDVFRRHPRVFPPVILEMTAAGEESGRLDKTLEEVADYLDREYQVVSRMKGAMVYPAVVVLALIFCPTMPILMTKGPGAYLAVTMGWLALLVLGGGGFLAVFRMAMSNPALAMTYEHIKLAIPVVGKVVRQFALGKFGRILGLLYSAGLPLSRALSIAATSCGNRYLAAELLKTVPIVESGGGFAEAIGRTQCFPPIAMHMIATGEKTGNVDLMVNKVAEFAEADANQAVDQAVTLMLPVSVIILAVFVGFVVVGFYGNYFTSMLNAGS
jgi:type IV pilus assembly protein PilC